MENVKELPGSCNADLNSPLAHFENIAVQSADDEQSPSDSTESNFLGDMDARFSEASDAGSDHDPSFWSRSSSVDISRDQNSDHSTPTRSEAHRSAHFSNTYQPLSGLKYIPLRRYETMPAYRKRERDPVPEKSPNLTRQSPSTLKQPSLRQSETMILDRMRSYNSVILKSLNLKENIPLNIYNRETDSEIIEQMLAYQKRVCDFALGKSPNLTR